MGQYTYKTSKNLPKRKIYVVHFTEFFPFTVELILASVTVVNLETELDHMSLATLIIRRCLSEILAYKLTYQWKQKHMYRNQVKPSFKAHNA